MDITKPSDYAYDENKVAFLVIENIKSRFANLKPFVNKKTYEQWLFLINEEQLNKVIISLYLQRYKPYQDYINLLRIGALKNRTKELITSQAQSEMFILYISYKLFLKILQLQVNYSVSVQQTAIFFEAELTNRLALDKEVLNMGGLLKQINATQSEPTQPSEAKIKAMLAIMHKEKAPKRLSFDEIKRKQGRLKLIENLSLLADKQEKVCVFSIQSRENQDILTAYELSKKAVLDRLKALNTELEQELVEQRKQVEALKAQESKDDENQTQDE